MLALHHTNRGNHPVAVVGYLLMLAGFAVGGLWLVLLAGGNAAGALAAGIGALALFAIAIAILVTMGMRLHHAAVIPDTTDAETEHYLHEYRD